MSQVISWLGNASYGVAGNRFRVDVPVVFRPTDISGLLMWLDANDSDSVNATPFGLVESWHNKGDLSGNFDISGSATVRYGDNLVNGLNVVTFNGDSFLSGVFGLNTSDRSIFIVSRRNQDISGGIFTWLTSDSTDGMETGISESAGAYTYLVSKHPGFAVELGFTTTVNTTGTAELVTFVNSSTDLSGNYLALNGTAQTFVVNNLANYELTPIPYYLGNYFGGATLPNDYDLCEVIIYNTALNATQISQVEEYLTRKWSVPVLPPEPFSPKNIAGLSLWFDAENKSSLTVDTSGTVLSWSNLGSVATAATSNTGIVTVVTDVASKNNVQFQAGTDLTFYTSLNYNSRTQFVVFKDITQLRLVSDQTLSFIYGDALYGLKSGVNWDSNSDTFQYTLGYPGDAQPNPIGITGDNPLSNVTLATFVTDSTDGTLCKFYLNNGSNINVSDSGLDEFNKNPIPYYLNFASNAQGQNMCEFLEYDSVLSSSNISTVTAYLSDKWNLGF